MVCVGEGKGRGSARLGLGSGGECMCAWGGGSVRLERWRRAAKQETCTKGCSCCARSAIACMRMPYACAAQTRSAVACLLMSKLTAEARPCNEEPRPPLKSARGRLDGSDGLPVADRGDKTKEEAEDATPYRHGFHFADFKTRFKTHNKLTLLLKSSGRSDA